MFQVVLQLGDSSTFAWWIFSPSSQPAINSLSRAPPLPSRRACLALSQLALPSVLIALLPAAHILSVPSLPEGLICSLQPGSGRDLSLSFDVLRQELGDPKIGLQGMDLTC